MKTSLRHFRQTPRAFTLVELLVVIAIIGILASLLTASLSRAKASAKSTTCKNNLRQLGIGFRMYLNEFDKFPLAAPKESEPPIKGFWYMHLQAYASSKPYTGNAAPLEPPFLCPISLPIPNVANAAGYQTYSNKVLQIFYGYNAYGTRGGLGVSESQNPWADPSRNLGLGLHCKESHVANPAGMLMAGCGNPYVWTRLLSPDPSIATFTGSIHQRGANMVFVDGHVEWKKSTNWVAPVDAARRLWNNDHEPHRESWQDAPQ